MNLRSRVGLFGGTFNPIHNAHLKVAKQALAQMDLAKVIFIPSKIPPHKDAEGIPPADRRYEMVKLAIQGEENFEVSDVEIKRSGPSYTVDTIEQMKDKYERVAFIVGADNLLKIDTWKQPEKLLDSCPFIVAPRHGQGAEDLQKGIFEGKDIRFLDMEEIDLSSTKIRKSFQNDAAVDGLVPEPVRRYIEKEGLYRSVSQGVRSSGLN